MVQYFKERLEQMDENGPQIVDIPLIALLIFAAIIVVGGEIGCVIWSLIIICEALFMGAAKLLMLIPCAILGAILTSIIVFVAYKVGN